MNIIIHGATDQNSSNFGDFIYGNEIYKRCLINNNNVAYYNPSSFFKKYTYNYTDKKIKVRDADLLIYMPGGYFGEVKNPGIKRCIKNFFRYMPFGLKGIMFKKNIIIIGLGAGPVYSLFLKWPLKRILPNAKVITVRDDESKRTLEELGGHNVFDFNDMILSFDLFQQGVITNQIRTVLAKAQKKKIILIHYNHSEIAMKLFAKALNKFLFDNGDYIAVVAADSIIEQDEDRYKKFNQICPNSIYFKYNSPYEFIELLKSIDTVVTCKLHAGVVATMLKKSVISIADHYEKTERYYNIIGYPERCISLESADVDGIYEMISQYSGKEMKIPESVIEKSKQHSELLLKYL